MNAQPISTAPRDGTHILAADLNSRDKIWTAVHWFEDGWYLSINALEEHAAHGCATLTHWLPQPDGRPHGEAVGKSQVPYAYVHLKTGTLAVRRGMSNIDYEKVKSDKEWSALWLDAPDVTPVDADTRDIFQRMADAKPGAIVPCTKEELERVITSSPISPDVQANIASMVREIAEWGGVESDDSLNAILAIIRKYL